MSKSSEAPGASAEANYYLVTREELEGLVKAKERMLNLPFAFFEHARDVYSQAQAACLARPVPEWATHFVKGEVQNLGDVEGFDAEDWEEIKK